MSDKPRQWFQVHFSTAVMLMFAAAALLWLNCRPVVYNQEINVRGFPIPFLYSTMLQESLGHTLGPFEPIALGVDIYFGLVVLTALGLIIECRIRRIHWVIIGTYLIAFGMFSFVVLMILAFFALPWMGHRQGK